MSQIRKEILPEIETAELEIEIVLPEIIYKISILDSLELW